MAQSNEQRIRFANDEIIGKRDLSQVEKVFATDYVVDAEGNDYRGHEFVRKFVDQLGASFPDLRVVAVDVLARDGDRIAWQRTCAEPTRPI